MRKLFLFSFIICFSICNAQSKFGVKAGINIPSLTGDDVSDEIKSQVGFYAGGTANFMAGNNFSVQPELLFSVKGFNYSELGEKVTSSFSYLSLPVLARYISTSGFYGETGPQLAFLLSAKRKADGIPGGEEDNKDSFKSTAFSWGIGLGYNLKSGLGIGARYNFGLNSISEASNIEARFNVLRLGLSWTFGNSSKSSE